MPDQYRIKGQPDIIKVQTHNVLKYGDKWDITWKDPEIDPKDFYESFKARLEFFGIRIKSYMELTREESVCAINEQNSDNFEQASCEMSKAIYTAMSDFRSKWFGDNPKLELLCHYEDDRDGFNLLKDLVKEYHLNLKDLTKIDTMEKPHIDQYDTFFKYMKYYRRWVEFERTSVSKQQYMDEEHVSNVLKEIENIEEFALAKQTIEVE